MKLFWKSVKIQLKDKYFVYIKQVKFLTQLSKSTKKKVKKIIFNSKEFHNINIFQR